MAHRITHPDHIARTVFIWTIIYACVFAAAVYFTMFRGA